MKTIEDLKRRVAIQIVALNILLVFILITYYILQGFDSKEFFATFTLITSVSAVYLGVVFQKIKRNIRETIKQIQEEEMPPEIKFPKIIAWLIPIHFITLFIVISLKAFTIITFQDMNLFLSGIESCFGVYMGGVLVELYETQNENIPNK